jgi:hypothetical protein
MIFSYKMAVFLYVAQCSLVYVHGSFRETCCIHDLRQDGLSTVLSSVVKYEVSNTKRNPSLFLLASQGQEEKVLRGSYRLTCLEIKITIKRGPEYNDLYMQKV